MKIGQRLLWYRTIDKYGHTRIVPVIVREIGEKVVVEAPYGRGTKLFRVQPERLREVSR